MRKPPQNTVAALWLTALVSAGATGQQREPTSKYYALRIDAEESGREGQYWVHRIGSAFHARAFQDELAKRYGIVLVERPENTGPEKFTALLKRFLASNPSAKSVAVYVSGPSLFILTGQIIVVFKDRTPETDARAVLSTFGLRIVGQPSKLMPEQFVVQARPDDDAADLAKKLALDPRVRFAEPDLLSISPRATAK